MNELSPAARKVFKRACENSNFAKSLIQNTDKTLKPYQLNNEEVDCFKEFTSEDEIHEYYKVYSSLHGIPSSKLNINLVIVIWVLLSALFLAFVLISTYYPEFLSSLGIGLWSNINPVVKQILFVYWLIATIALFGFSVRILSDMQISTRVALMIVLIVVLFVPASFILNSLAHEIKVTITNTALIIIFTMLPSSLYLIFMTSKGRTLWDEFAYNLIHLEPVRYRNLLPIYLKKFETIYGPVGQVSFNKTFLRIETSIPVLLTTIIMGLGWLLFFTISSSDPKSPFMGIVSPFTFGFLGAYLFSLQLLFRRYVQSDLKPTAYTHSGIRILTTWIWAFVLSILPWQSLGVDINNENQIISVMAFVIGVFPEVAWQVIGMFTQRLLAIPLPNFRQTHPLSEIKGITIWVEARLLEEDIENVQNLVTTDIFDLMLNTNLHPRRIINWIDQGILLLHLDQKSRSENKSEGSLADAFTERGIITATDLLECYGAFQKHQKIFSKNTVFINCDLDAIVKILAQSIDNDPNMYHVKAWNSLNAKLNKKLQQSIDKNIRDETQTDFFPELMSSSYQNLFEFDVIYKQFQVVENDNEASKS